MRGYTYLLLLFLVAISGAALAGVAQVWHTYAQREKESELMFVGRQFQLAIESYYRASPGSPQFPQSLDDLLKDQRFPGVRRHLRKIFVDPMTGKAEWGIQRQEGIGIFGVHSLSEGVPIKQTNFEAKFAQLDGAKTYRNWIFAFNPLMQDQPATLAAAGAGTVPTASAPSVITAVAPVAPESPAEIEQKEKSRDRMCSIQLRSDSDTCQIAQRANGPQMMSRCTASAARRNRGCLDGTADAASPLETSAY
ncbi:MAG: type II secretion system protein [Betaproteobacteria bacterium]